MKIALVHDWTIHMRGGEKVLDALAELFPGATLYTLFSDRKKLSPNLRRLRIKNSFLQYLPGIRHFYRWLLPLMPFAVRSLQIEDADLVISSSHCVAKGIRKPAGAFHICYCHTPARYLWGFEETYFSRFIVPVRRLIAFFLDRLRRHDLESNAGVDLFIANSECVRERILKFYKRDAIVIHPPVDIDFYRSDKNGAAQAPEGARDYYLAISHFVPYKRLDLAIEVFNRLDRRLLIVGSGPLERRYKQMRKSAGISFLGAVPDAELRKLYARARAVIFPAEEDFGIVPVEAQACGTPVIAYAKGGSLETVKSGVFFDEQTPEAVLDAVKRFEALPFDPAIVRERIESFGRNRFLDKIRQTVTERAGER
ncbi:MAG: GDP-mannose-dependent alpha-(1-6)-phosphatidylinositol monomannoside mannosyltransferase [Candidatus Omnitrophica bacterium ADurb.Bin277]|jgi:glycosyltransferase involved in cell wall biosynthesis|nr:MAG: GDP-mannose-dependent alpha-(1-6)-phosphatidylinositol monomannoside mannosyltransferase [Candidatus Omnitrophica bacterium ADurb.Bin277]